MFSSAMIRVKTIRDMACARRFFPWHSKIDGGEVESCCLAEKCALQRCGVLLARRARVSARFSQSPAFFLRPPFFVFFLSFWLFARH